MESHRVIGAIWSGFFFKSTTISTVLRALRPRLFLLHKVTRSPTCGLPTRDEPIQRIVCCCVPKISYNRVFEMKRLRIICDLECCCFPRMITCLRSLCVYQLICHNTVYISQSTKPIWPQHVRKDQLIQDNK